ncbi:BPG-independent [Roridomyces roridus]|uniref:phosphoglycerate mutase (2,3-diphosphoglycerate-independent) n=1 Tax=Roridomyces roridus TaxID=1738132 RepID=A0AAD7BSC3_9AGAR|nr:BPG-independent [Roridomyces roridus]
MSSTNEKVCLTSTMAGESPRSLEGNAIEAGPAAQAFAAPGAAVGLSEGLMGNSEVGHLNIGAGWQDIVRIDVSIKKREFHKNKTILESFERAKSGNGRLHFLGLAHPSRSPLYALLEAAKEQNVPHVYVHPPPRSAVGYCQDLLDFMAKEKYGALATVVGRYYAMDRDKRWEGVKVVGGDVTDEFMKPVIVNGDEGRIKDDDIFLNYRSDRMREISAVFGLPDKPMDVTIPKNLHIMTAMTNVLAEWLAAKGKKQTHIAETENCAHVTFLFNGGVEAQFTGEERHMIASPKVATYDLQPEKMAVQAVADKVGPSGKYDAAVQAITATDSAVGTIYAACQDACVLSVRAGRGGRCQHDYGGLSVRPTHVRCRSR